MDTNEALNILKSCGGFLEGHFLLASGRHSANYLQCAKLFQHANFAEPLCADLAEQIKKSGIKADVCAGPAIGAILMVYEVSRHLGVRNIFAERETDVFQFRRGFEINPGEKVVVVEDTVTTGGSVRKVMDLVRSLGGNVAAVASIVDRSGGKVDFGVPFFSVIRVDVASYEKEDCPLCKKMIPVVKPGSSKLKV